MDKQLVFGIDDKERFAPFLISSSEKEGNGISFTIALSKCGKKGELLDDNEGGNAVSVLLRKATPIYPDECKVYEIIFEDYILHLVRNESYTSYDDYEVFTGKHFVVFEKSRLLDMLPQLTDCAAYKDGSFYPKEWTHYGLCCQDHVIDIISCSKPAVKKLAGLKGSFLQD